MYILRLLCCVTLCVSQTTLAAQQCPDIGLLDKSGQYIILDKDNLKLKKVGDLRWLDINDINAPTQSSTIDKPVIHIDRYVTSNISPSEDGGFAVLPPLISYSPSMEKPKLISSNKTLTKQVFSNGVAFFSNESGDLVGEIYNFLDSDNNGKSIIKRYANTKYHFNTRVCSQNDSYYLLHDGQYFSMANSHSPRKNLNELIGIDDFYINAQYQCNFIVQERSSNKPKNNHIVINPANDTKTSQFASYLYAKYFIYGETPTVIQQKITKTSLNGFPNAYTSHYQPQVMKTQFDQNGKLISQKEYTIEGEIEKVVCPAGDAKLVVKESNKIKLIELENFKTLGEFEHPFKYKQVFVL